MIGIPITVENSRSFIESTTCACRMFSDRNAIAWMVDTLSDRLSPSRDSASEAAARVKETKATRSACTPESRMFFTRRSSSVVLPVPGGP